jgi:hypothetical protein
MSNQKVGYVSLGAAIAGLALAVPMPMVPFFVGDSATAYAALKLWVATVAVLELVAVVLGVRGWRTDSGLAGLVLACFSLVLLFCVLSARVKAVLP